MLFARAERLVQSLPSLPRLSPRPLASTSRLGDRRQLCRREDVARIRHAVLDADAGGGGARRHLREPIHSLRCEETLFTGCLPAAICASQSPPRLADCVSGAKWSSS